MLERVRTQRNSSREIGFFQRQCRGEVRGTWKLDALSEQMRSMRKKLNKLKSTAAEEVIRLPVVIFLETQTLAKDK